MTTSNFQDQPKEDLVRILDKIVDLYKNDGYSVEYVYAEISDLLEIEG